MKIVIVACAGGTATGIAGLVDMFSLCVQASTLADAKPAGRWQVLVASADGRPAADRHGGRIRVDGGLADVARADAVLVPPLVAGPGDALPPAEALQAFAPWLRRQHAQGAAIGGACTGSFVLGEAGLLDRRRCAATWWLFEEFRHRYPDADALWGRSLVTDGAVITAGGPLSWVELGLAVIRRLGGAAAAQATAEYAVVDGTSLPQTAYVSHGSLESSRHSPFRRSAEIAIRKAGPRSFATRELAQAMNVSERTLHRRLAVLGESPGAFITRVRLDTARMRLETTAQPVKAIRTDTGYADDAGFRRAFTRYSGLSPAAYRAWSNRRREGPGAP